MREAGLARRSRLRLAPGVRVAATRDGTLLASSQRIVRLRGEPEGSFVLDALPALVSDDAEQPGWLVQLCEQLASAGMVVRDHASTTLPEMLHLAPVASVRETTLIARVRERLATVGIELAEGPAPGTLMVVDLSGLDAASCRALVEELHVQRIRSFPLWRIADETFLGPWTEPLHTACWNCCVSRLGLNANGDELGEDEATTRAVAENIILAARHPHLLAPGCVVTDRGKSELHSVLPMPWCDVCGGAAQLDTLGVAHLRQSSIVPSELQLLADTRGSVVNRVLVFEGDTNDAPAMPFAASALVGPYRHGTQSRRNFSGEGKGGTRDGAIRSAIGEAIERYAASIWDPARLDRASLNSLGADAFDPRWLVLYDNTQYSRPGFPYAPFDENAPHYWVEGTWLDTHEAVHLPALATFMHFEAETGERFAQVTSNGLAAQSTFEGAALSALYELIERDAFMLYWLAERPALRVDPSGCDQVTSRALHEVGRLGANCELYLLDVGTNHPTIICLGLGDGSTWPGATIGLGTHAHVDIALRHAVLEHGHAGTYIRRLMLEGRHESIDTADQVLTGLDHALYYVPVDKVRALDTLRGGTESITLAELRSRYHQEATLDACVAALRDSGIRTAAADVTSPDVALAPLRVVRVFGVYMQPIYFGTANRRLQNPRLDKLLAGPAASEPHPLA